MTMFAKPCPFKAGDKVIYKPSQRGRDLEVMSSQKLIPGKEYEVLEIQNSAYVVLKGVDHPGGGLYWTEFKAAK